MKAATAGNKGSLGREFERIPRHGGRWNDETRRRKIISVFGMNINGNDN
ncbi:hypothetical protein ABEV00_02950 [Paenibacillus thiaminolyticus]